jgi:hypothetical protein
MLRQRTEFVIHHRVEGEFLAVVGRCGAVPIRVGDTFDTAAKVRRPRPDHPEDYAADLVQIESRSVDVHVVAIHAYEKSRDLLDVGMTGTLVLEGRDTTFAEAGWVLNGPATQVVEAAATRESMGAGRR